MKKKVRVYAPEYMEEGGQASQGGGDQMQQLMQMVQQAIEQGEEPGNVAKGLLGQQVPPEAIMQVFVQMGMPEDQAQTTIQEAMQGGGQQGPTPQEQVMALGGKLMRFQGGGQPSPEEMAMMQQQQNQQPGQGQEGQHQMPDGSMMNDSDMPQEQGGGDQMQQLMQMVQQMMEQGAQPQDVVMELLQQQVPPEAIMQTLVQIGMPEQEAQQVIQQVMQGGQQGPGPEQQAQQGEPSPQEPQMNFGGNVKKLLKKKLGGTTLPDMTSPDYVKNMNGVFVDNIRKNSMMASLGEEFPSMNGQMKNGGDLRKFSGPDGPSDVTDKTIGFDYKGFFSGMNDYMSKNPNDAKSFGAMYPQNNYNQNYNQNYGGNYGGNYGNNYGGMMGFNPGFSNVGFGQGRWRQPSGVDVRINDGSQFDFREAAQGRMPMSGNIGGKDYRVSEVEKIRNGLFRPKSYKYTIDWGNAAASSTAPVASKTNPASPASPAAAGFSPEELAQEQDYRNQLNAFETRNGELADVQGKDGNLITASEAEALYKASLAPEASSAAAAAVTGATPEESPIFNDYGYSKYPEYFKGSSNKASQLPAVPEPAVTTEPIFNDYGYSKYPEYFKGSSNNLINRSFGGFLPKADNGLEVKDVTGADNGAATTFETRNGELADVQGPDGNLITASEAEALQKKSTITATNKKNPINWAVMAEDTKRGLDKVNSFMERVNNFDPVGDGARRSSMNAPSMGVSNQGFDQFGNFMGGTNQGAQNFNPTDNGFSMNQRTFAVGGNVYNMDEDYDLSDDELRYLESKGLKLKKV